MEELIKAKETQEASFKELLEVMVKLGQETYYCSGEFEEEAAEYCREQGWKPPA